MALGEGIVHDILTSLFCLDFPKLNLLIMYSMLSRPKTYFIDEPICRHRGLYLLDIPIVSVAIPDVGPTRLRESLVDLDGPASNKQWS